MNLIEWIETNQRDFTNLGDSIWEFRRDLNWLSLPICISQLSSMLN